MALRKGAETTPTSSTASLPPLSRVRWPKTYRLVASSYPPIDLFERIADPEDWEILSHLEGLTNDRLRDEIGDIAMVPVEERVVGQGPTPIMAAFTHRGFPSRFTDGSYGVYYASNRFEAALREVLYHRERFLRRTAELRTRFDLRTYVGSIDADLSDVCGGWPAIHDVSSYGASQALGRRIRCDEGNGVVYDSVRSPGDQNIAVFRPSILAAKAGGPHVRQGAHVRVEWDGSRMTRYIVIGDAAWRSLS